MPCMNEAGIFLPTAAVTLLRQSHQAAEPTNTPATIGPTVNHRESAPAPDSGDIGPSAANTPMNEMIVIGLDRVKPNVVRKARAVDDRGEVAEAVCATGLSRAIEKASHSRNTPPAIFRPMLSAGSAVAIPATPSAPSNP